MTTIKINRKDKEALKKVCAIASISAYYHDEEGDLLLVTLELEDTTAVWYLARMLENQIGIDECQAIKKKIRMRDVGLIGGLIFALLGFGMMIVSRFIEPKYKPKTEQAEETKLPSGYYNDPEYIDLTNKLLKINETYGPLLKMLIEKNELKRKLIDNNLQCDNKLLEEIKSIQDRIEPLEKEWDKYWPTRDLIQIRYKNKAK